MADDRKFAAVQFDAMWNEKRGWMEARVRDVSEGFASSPTAKMIFTQQAILDDNVEVGHGMIENLLRQQRKKTLAALRRVIPSKFVPRS